MVQILHNPRCSKSRETLQLLEEKGLTPDIQLYLEKPPTKKALKEIISMLGMESARDLMRKKEAEYKENDLANPQRTEKELLDALVQFPRLIERPIVINGNKAAIGRPPESVLEIL